MNTPTSAGASRFTRFTRSGSGVLGVVLGIVFALFGLVLMVGALLLGLVVAVAALLWSILRGRRPGPVRFEWRRGMARAWRPASGRPQHDDVVDIEVREVTDRSPSLPHR